MSSMEFADRLQAALGPAYTVERELPLGGLGRLFLATEVATGRALSVQVLPPDIAARLDVNRFRAGMDRVARLRHPGIAPIVAVGAAGDLVWCIWPHPAGESLRYRLVRDGGLSNGESVQVLHDVADALAYGHAQGVSHDDLKVDNIYIEQGRAVIAEFGIRSALNQALGTASDGLDARADVHALAVAGQQMVGGRASAVSAVIARALSIDPTEQFADAGAFRDALGTPPRTVRRRLHARLGVLGAAVVVLAAVVVNATRARQELDPDLVAVAPFEILDQSHEIWGEGLMTLLSANLSGAGPIRTVSPTLVVRRWEGRVDDESAVALARRTGARMALYGRLVPMGGDSVRLQATLVDAWSGGNLAEVRVEDDEARLDRLTDSLSMRLLRELSRTRPIGATRRAATLGSRSFPALKAFLEGEQYFRRSQWDSAVAHYQRAIELDSTFAMALFRAGIVMGWQRFSADELSTEYLRRAGENNHGLTLRDSLLVAAESLSSAIETGARNPRYWEHYRRIHSTVAELTRRFPRDPEAWYEAGETYYHYPVLSSLRQMRAAFDQAVALDSAFAPAYIHLIGVALEQGDMPGALHYIDRYLALEPRDHYADAIRLTRRLIDPAQSRLPEVQQAIDTASMRLLTAIMNSYPGWPDSLEGAIRLTRAMNTAHPGAPGREHANEQPGQLLSALMYHGRFREAWQYARALEPAFPLPPSLISDGLWFGTLPAESVRTILEAGLRSEPLYHSAPVLLSAPWWGMTGDTMPLRELARRGELELRSATSAGGRAFGRYVVDAAQALLLLARGDTLGAIRGLQALPDTVCTRCVLYKLTLARLLDARRMDHEAAALLSQDSPGFVQPVDGFWALFRARLADRRGDRDEAIRQWQYVRAVWVNADSALQGYVREARGALAREVDRD